MLSQGVYQSSADVWSWAVCVWEILTLGEEPYGDMSADDVMDLLLTAQSRLAQPVNCPDDIHQVLLQCWAADALRRPDFAGLVQIMDGCLSEQGVEATVSSAKQAWAEQATFAAREETGRAARPLQAPEAAGTSGEGGGSLRKCRNSSVDRGADF